jgi:hypothetical protein
MCLDNLNLFLSKLAYFGEQKPYKKKKATFYFSPTSMISHLPATRIKVSILYKRISPSLTVGTTT